MKYLALSALLVSFAFPSAAMAADNPAPTVAQLLARTPGADGVFVADGAGAVRHVKSGLLCPASYPNVNLWRLEVSATDGNDIGCDYVRNDADNRVSIELNIHVTPVRPGDTIEIVFARYEAELKAEYSNAQAPEPPVQFEGGPPFAKEAVRSQTYSVMFAGRPSLGMLTVEIKGGWVIATRLAAITEAGVTDQAAIAAQNNMLFGLASIQAEATVGTRPTAAGN